MDQTYTLTHLIAFIDWSKGIHTKTTERVEPHLPSRLVHVHNEVRRREVGQICHIRTYHSYRWQLPNTPTSGDLGTNMWGERFNHRLRFRPRRCCQSLLHYKNKIQYRNSSLLSYNPRSVSPWHHVGSTDLWI